uniref:Uncharacterized protein n=1 Tax=Amphimedon queenslandica TaxID=400682 RepID=A0A1X7VE93_AMPQE
MFDVNMLSHCMIYNGKSFLAEKGNLALIINVDWFQPFKRTEYIVGEIDLAVLHLPRSMHYTPKNIIVGINPDPKEPSSLNLYLSPSCDELLDKWDNRINRIKGLLLFVLPYYVLLVTLRQLLNCTSKHFMKLSGLERKLLCYLLICCTFKKIANVTKLPSSIGRLMHKIRSNFLSSTANQCRNCMSSVGLYGILPEDHFKC